MIVIRESPVPVARLLFRWNQKARPWKHCELFSASSEADLVVQAMAALERFKPVAKHPLLLQSVITTPDQQTGRKIIFLDLPGPLGGAMWPWQIATARDELDVWAARLWVMACDRLVIDSERRAV